MKFLVTYVLLSRLTSRRMGKAETRVVDTADADVSNAFYQLETPMAVEEAFEGMWRDRPRDKCKVVDVRALDERTPA